MANQLHLNPPVTPEKYASSVLNLLKFAQMDCGGSRVCAQVLLSAYNGSEFQLDITDLCLLDEQLYSDALTVIRGRVELNVEPHILITDGDKLFDKLWRQWDSYNVKSRWRWAA
jgi:hypothetical protein